MPESIERRIGTERRRGPDRRQSNWSAATHADPHARTRRLLLDLDHALEAWQDISAGYDDAGNPSAADALLVCHEEIRGIVAEFRKGEGEEG